MEIIMYMLLQFILKCSFVSSIELSYKKHISMQLFEVQPQIVFLTFAPAMSILDSEILN